MINFDFERLRSLGLTPALAALAAGTDEPDAGPSQLMRLTEAHRETVRLHDGFVEHRAVALPRLLRTLAEQGTALAVGDWVLAATDAHGQTWVRARVPPLSHLARRDADGRRHALVSNVDTALLVMGLDDDFNLRRLERYLALVQGSGMAPVVVLSKADLVAPTPGLLQSRLDIVRSRIAVPVDLLAVNATSYAAATALAPYLAGGQTLVLLGSSGAGKSTLTNTLLGVAQQDTGAARENDGRGKHTTTSRSLHRIPGGACVIDTPGLRALQPDIDAAALAAAFCDIDALATHCRFRDCSHRDEPGCAVREGVNADRLRNFHKLSREARRDSMSVLERRQQLAMWKSRGRAARTQLKLKRGEN